MNKNILRIALATGCILLIPLTLQLTIGTGVDGQGFNWKPGDFVFAGALLFGAGLTYEFVARKANTAAYKTAVGLAVGTTLLLLWVNAAVGVIGGDNDANLMYAAVIATGFIGAIASRLQPRGLSITLFAMAAIQIAIPAAVLILWPDVSWGAAGVTRTFILNAFFALLFVGSGLLFQRASAEKKQPSTPDSPDASLQSQPTSSPKR